MWPSVSEDSSFKEPQDQDSYHFADLRKILTAVPRFHEFQQNPIVGHV